MKLNKLNNGNSIPVLWFGLWKIPQEKCAEIVYNAIKIWYRHFDSASDYGNEKEVWDGIKKAVNDRLCERWDLFITSKLWNTYHKPEHVEAALQKTLDDLQLNYLDLYMIHFPIALEYVDFSDRYPSEWINNPASKNPCMKIAKVPLYQTRWAMEDLVEKKLVKNIWVCNYNTGLIHDLISYSKIKPSVIQIESHPYLTQNKLLELCINNGISVTAFSPLGSIGYKEIWMDWNQKSLLEQDNILNRYKKTAVQIILRWRIQRCCNIIPKASSIVHMQENIDIFDFELTRDEMKQIDSLNINKRFNDPGEFCKTAFNTFYPIYD